MSERKTINVTLDVEIIDVLDQLALNIDKSKAQIIRWLLARTIRQFADDIEDNAVLAVSAAKVLDAQTTEWATYRLAGIKLPPTAPPKTLAPTVQAPTAPPPQAAPQPVPQEPESELDLVPYPDGSLGPSPILRKQEIWFPMEFMCKMCRLPVKVVEEHLDRGDNDVLSYGGKDWIRGTGLRALREESPDRKFGLQVYEWGSNYKVHAP